MANYQNNMRCSRRSIQPAQNAQTVCQNRMGGCPDTHDHFPAHMPVAMAYVPWQKWQDIWDETEAFQEITEQSLSQDETGGGPSADSQASASDSEAGQSLAEDGSVEPDNNQYITDFSQYELQKDAVPQVNQLISGSRELQVVNHTIKNPVFSNLFFHNPNVIQFLTQDETSMC